jgi:hypothetical protein
LRRCYARVGFAARLQARKRSAMSLARHGAGQGRAGGDGPHRGGYDLVRPLRLFRVESLAEVGCLLPACGKEASMKIRSLLAAIAALILTLGVAAPVGSAAAARVASCDPMQRRLASGVRCPPPRRCSASRSARRR